MNYRSSKFIFEIASQILVVMFGFLAFYHIKNFQTFQIKLGMSDFFTPVTVGYLSKIIISLDLIACISLLFYKRKYTYFLSGCILIFYSIYNFALYLKPGSDCGCANILFSNTSTLLQLTLFSLLSFISFISISLLNKTSNSVKIS